MHDEQQIVFVERENGRRAALASCGLEIWEVIATWKEGDESSDVLRRAISGVSESLLRVALDY